MYPWSEEPQTTQELSFMRDSNTVLRGWTEEGGAVDGGGFFGERTENRKIYLHLIALDKKERKTPELRK